LPVVRISPEWTNRALWTSVFKSESMGVKLGQWRPRSST
jgi:hypothetical protein